MKLLAILTAACLLACGALADGRALSASAEISAAEGAVTLWFEEGFGLELPRGWMRYPVSAEDMAAGVRCALGDGGGANFLYVHIRPTTLKDAAALEAAVLAEPACVKPARLTFGGVDFVAFIDASRGASCCAAVIGENRVTFIFVPQSDPDYMLAASRLMETFRLA